jgi:hypothetical protein
VGGDGMGLLEESGIILRNGEDVLKQGRCKGRVPKGIEMKTSTLGVYLLRLKSKQKVEWDSVDGELVLTNHRLFALHKKGRIRKDILFYELGVVGAAIKSSRFGKDKLMLRLNVGKPQSETTEFEVDEPSEWVSAIVDAMSKVSKETEVQAIVS